jgi:hypothetical protein
MNECSSAQNRRQRRSNVLLTAVLEISGRALEVKLRNLSAEGALVEADSLPVEGASIRFRRHELAVNGKVVWVRGNRAGISFAEPLTPEALLRHVPTPRPRIIPEFRRPGLAPRPLSPDEQRLGEIWVRPLTIDQPGD